MPACCDSKDCCSHASDSMALHCRLTPLLEAAGHSQASLAQSLVGSLLLSPGSWCTQGFVVPSKSLFPGGFSVLLSDTQVGKVVVGIELLQQCENFFGIIVLQFVGCLLSDSMWC